MKLENYFHFFFNKINNNREDHRPSSKNHLKFLTFLLTKTDIKIAD